MDILLRVFDNLVHVTVVLLLPPLLLGVIVKTKAWFGGRRGAPLLQVYYDLFKLFQKGSVFSTTTTWVFRAGPVVALVTTLLASLLLPLGNHGAPLSFTGDLFLVLYLFALGRFFTTCAALDTGSSFEGMGAAREVTFACLAEPSLMFGFLVLAKLSGEMSLTGMFRDPLAEWSVGGAAVLLVLISWFIVLLAENSRIPFDDPNTHLELTMIHEVMVLDHSGPAFGMILYGAALKLFVFGAMVMRLALPFEAGNSLLGWGLFIAAMLVLAAAVGIVESVMARLRLPYISHVLIAASILPAFGLLLVVIE